MALYSAVTSVADSALRHTLISSTSPLSSPPLPLVSRPSWKRPLSRAPSRALAAFVLTGCPSRYSTALPSRLTLSTTWCQFASFNEAMPCPCPGRSIRVLPSAILAFRPLSRATSEKPLDMPLSNQSLLEIRTPDAGLVFPALYHRETEKSSSPNRRLSGVPKLTYCAACPPQETPVLSIWTALPLMPST